MVIAVFRSAYWAKHDLYTREIGEEEKEQVSVVTASF
jgi:hypothetical protein